MLDVVVVGTVAPTLPNLIKVVRRFGRPWVVLSLPRRGCDDRATVDALWTALSAVILAQLLRRAAVRQPRRGLVTVRRRERQQPSSVTVVARAVLLRAEQVASPGPRIPPPIRCGTHFCFGIY